MDVLQGSYDLITAGAAVVQTVLLLRKPSRPAKGGRKMQQGDFILSRKRAVALTVTILLLVGGCVWTVFYPRESYDPLPEDQLTKVSGQQFINQEIDLDGNYFEYCSFANVTFRIHGRHNFVMEHVKISGPVRLLPETRHEGLAMVAAVAILNNAGMIANGRVDVEGTAVVIEKASVPNTQ